MGRFTDLFAKRRKTPATPKPTPVSQESAAKAAAKQWEEFQAEQHRQLIEAAHEAWLERMAHGGTDGVGFTTAGTIATITVDQDTWVDLGQVRRPGRFWDL